MTACTCNCNCHRTTQACLSDSDIEEAGRAIRDLAKNPEKESIDKPLDWSKPIQRRDGAYAEALMLRGITGTKQGVVVWPDADSKPSIDYYAGDGRLHRDPFTTAFDIINVPEEPETGVVDVAGRGDLYVYKSNETSMLSLSEHLFDSKYHKYLGKLTIDIGELER